MCMLRLLCVLVLSCFPPQERHEKVCTKNASKKRKPFDMTKQKLSYLIGEHLQPSKSRTASEIAVGVCLSCMHRAHAG